MAKDFPYFNDEAETKWKKNNLNQKIENEMKEVAKGEELYSGGPVYLKVGKMDAYKVHHMKFKDENMKIQFHEERGRVSLPTVQCLPHTQGIKEE